MSENKKIVFYDTPKRHADLNIRIKYDGFAFSEFFRTIITGYLGRDERIVSFVEEQKVLKNKFSSKKRADSERMHEKAHQNKEIFALDREEIENIFDLIEKEHYDL